MAVVLSVTHKGQPIQDALKLQRLQQMLFDMMDQKHQGIVTIKTVSRPFDVCLGRDVTACAGWSGSPLLHVHLSRHRVSICARVCTVFMQAALLKWPCVVPKR